MEKSICVYCSSSDHISSTYVPVAHTTGRLITERGYTLVYGGGNVGLMGVLARSVHESGGHVFGVIPEALKAVEGVAYRLADELVVTQTMQERKAIMYTKADAFLVLPGGFGTLEEFMEVLTLKQLRYHNKALALVNAGGFYDPLVELFEHFYRERFARVRYRDLYHLADSPEEALDYIDSYLPEQMEDKWK